MPLVVTQRILTLQPPVDRGFAVFEQRDEEAGGELATRLAMTYATWQDFGEPGHVTVTIEPGDTLNT